MNKEECTPASIFLSDVAEVSLHRHKSTEIIFLLSGSCSVTVNTQSFQLHEGDIFLVNSEIIHCYKTEPDCVHMILQFDLKKFPMVSDRCPVLYQVNSTLDPDNENYALLRSLLAELILVQEQPDFNTGAIGILYQIFSHLIQHFAVSEIKIDSSERYTPRLMEVLDYVNDHYREGLTLSSVAEHFSFSVPYFSVFFKKNMGQTFMEYYNNLRLLRTTDALLFSDDTIEHLACQNGFHDARAFVSLFKKRYGMRPSQYRRMSLQSPFPVAQSRDNVMFYPSLGKSTYVDKAREFMLAHSAPPARSAPKSPSVHISCGTLKVNFEGEKLFEQYTFQKTVFLEKLDDLLSHRLRIMLENAHQHCHFDEIRFPLDSEKFYLYEECINYLRSIRLKPIFVLLVSDEIHAPDYLKKAANILGYLIRVFGKKYIFSCHFIITELPEQLTDGTYYKAYRMLKNMYPDIFIICTAFSAITPEEISFYHSFLEDCRDEGCLPNCISFIYNERNILKKIPGGLAEYRSVIHKLMQDVGLGSLPYHFCDTENIHIGINPVNDTCFRSSYLVRKTLQNLGKSNFNIIWKLTDYTMGSIPPCPFFGGSGMYTYNGIPKPVYHVLEFISQLESEVLQVEDGWVITRNGSTFVILFYNYEFFKHLMQSPDTRSADPFQNMESTYFSLKLDQLEGQHYRVTQYLINQNYGSSFDAWTKMGSPESLNEQDLHFLKSINPIGDVYYNKIFNGIINLEVQLEPLEVRLIRIEIE